MSVKFILFLDKAVQVSLKIFVPIHSPPSIFQRNQSYFEISVEISYKCNPLKFFWKNVFSLRTLKNCVRIENDNLLCCFSLHECNIYHNCLIVIFSTGELSRSYSGQETSSEFVSDIHW